MKTFEDLTAADFESLLRLAYLEGVYDQTADQFNVDGFGVLKTFKERTDNKPE